MTVSISIDLVGFSPVFHSLIFEKITAPNRTSKICWLKTFQLLPFLRPNIDKSSPFFHDSNHLIVADDSFPMSPSERLVKFIMLVMISELALTSPLSMTNLYPPMLISMFT